jgi:hypothetical protein
MGAEIAGVEDALSLHLDQQHVRVERRVIRQVGRHGKRADLKSLPAFPWVEIAFDGLASESRGELDQSRRRLAGKYRPVGVGLLQEAVVVRMRVRDQHSVCRCGEIERRRQ